MTAPEPREDVAVADVLAEWLSWTSGEMTRYSPTAHEDHNRWSWRGDGHGDAIREQFRQQAEALAPLIAERVRAAAEKAWDEGFIAGQVSQQRLIEHAVRTNIGSRPPEPPPNPYRADRDDPEETE